MSHSYTEMSNSYVKMVHSYIEMSLLHRYVTLLHRDVTFQHMDCHILAFPDVDNENNFGISSEKASDLEVFKIQKMTHVNSQ